MEKESGSAQQTERKTGLCVISLVHGTHALASHTIFHAPALLTENHDPAPDDPDSVQIRAICEPCRKGFYGLQPLLDAGG